MKQILKLKQDKGTAGLTILLSLIVMIFVIGLIVMIFTLMSGALSNASFTPTSTSVSNEAGYVNGTGYTISGSLIQGFSTPVITALTNSSDTGSVVGELGWINGTGYTLKKAGLVGFNSPVIVTIKNTTDDVLIAVGNYTLNTTSGVLKNLTAAGTYLNVNITYTYNQHISTGNASVSELGVVTNTSSFNLNNAGISYTYTYSAPNSATTTINDTGNAVAGVVTYLPLFVTIGAMVVLILLTVIIITAIRSSGLVSGVAGQPNVGTA